MYSLSLYRSCNHRTSQPRTKLDQGTETSHLTFRSTSQSPYDDPLPLQKRRPCQIALSGPACRYSSSLWENINVVNIRKTKSKSIYLPNHVNKGKGFCFESRYHGHARYVPDFTYLPLVRLVLPATSNY